MNVTRERIDGAERIAVLRANALGDLVFTLPALAALRATYPSAELVLLGTTMHAELLSGRGLVDRVVALPPVYGVSTFRDGIEEPAATAACLDRLRDERFDLAVQLHGGGRHSNPFVSALGARVTIGLRDADAPPLDRWIRYVYWQPEILRQLEVVQLAGAVPVSPDPSFPVRADDHAAAARLALPERTVVLHPGATDPRRRWAAERFGALARWLHDEHGLAVRVTGVEAERPVVEAVCDAAGGAATPLLDLGWDALVGLLAHARMVVSNDTGPLHLAGAVGTPTVGIYWCGNLVNGGTPWRHRHRPLASWRIHCPECGTDCITGWCEHEPSFVDDLPLRTVQAACASLLADTGGDDHAAEALGPEAVIGARPASRVTGMRSRAGA